MSGRRDSSGSCNADGICVSTGPNDCEAVGKTCLNGTCVGECHPTTVEQSCPPKCDEDTGDLVTALCVDGECAYSSYGVPCANEGKVCAGGSCATGCAPETVDLDCPPVCDGDYVESSKCVDGGCVGGLYWNCQFDEMVCEGGQCVQACTEETLTEDCAPSMCSPDGYTAFAAGGLLRRGLRPLRWARRPLRLDERSPLLHRGRPGLPGRRGVLRRSDPGRLGGLAGAAHQRAPRVGRGLPRERARGRLPGHGLHDLLERLLRVRRVRRRQRGRPRAGERRLLLARRDRGSRVQEPPLPLHHGGDRGVRGSGDGLDPEVQHRRGRGLARDAMSRSSRVRCIRTP